MAETAGLYVFAAFLAVSFAGGLAAEKMHINSIKKREKNFMEMSAVTIEKSLDKEAYPGKVYLITAGCVMSPGFVRRIPAMIKTFFGGRIGFYESLVERGRKEVILRVKEEAIKAGCGIIINLRIETSFLDPGAEQKSGSGCVELMAYGTAVSLKKTG